MNGKISISVVIPTFNSSGTIVRTLHSLERSKFDRNKFEVLVIDDGSTDDTRQRITEFQKKTELQLRYFRQANSGPGPARNLGIHNARADVIAFTDADCIVDEDWLSVIYRSMMIDRNVIVSGDIRTRDFLISPWKTAPIGSSGVTANLAIRYSRLNGLLFSEENLFLGEDTDFVLRAQALGYGVTHVAEMKVEHPPHIYSLGQMIKRVMQRKNEVLLYKKYGEKVDRSFGWPFRPMAFRLSPATVIFVIAVVFFLFALKENHLLFFLCVIAALFLFFILYFYRYAVTNNFNDEKIPMGDRIKTLIFLLIYIPFFIMARIMGSIKFRFFMV